MVTVLDSSFWSNLHDYWYLTFVYNIKICLYKHVNIVHLKITFITRKNNLNKISHRERHTRQEKRHLVSSTYTKPFFS